MTTPVSTRMLILVHTAALQRLYAHTTEPTSDQPPPPLLHTHTQMWTMALRAFDDVKESVRAAAAGLLRSLRGLSLRLMDRQQSPAAGERGGGGMLPGGRQLCLLCDHAAHGQAAEPCCR
jgi:hypothetical protein